MAENYDTAKKFLGKHEVKDRAELMALFKQYKIMDPSSPKKPLDPSTTAWCAGFMTMIERMNGRKGTGSLMAKSYKNYGSPVEFNKAQKGDIVVFTRGPKHSPTGHVALFDGYEIGKDGQELVRTIGANQSNAVTVGWYQKSRLIAVRRP